MEKPQNQPFQRPENPQIASDVFAMFHHYTMTKSVNFLTENLENFIFKVEFMEEFPLQLGPRKIILFLYLNFISAKNIPPAVFTSPLPFENVPAQEMFPLVNVNFVNFDDVTPVYTREPVFLTSFWGKDIFIRAKVQRPYDGADFRDITLTFFLKAKCAKEDTPNA